MIKKSLIFISGVIVGSLATRFTFTYALYRIIKPELETADRSTNDYHLEDVVFENALDAKIVLSKMKAICNKYGVCTLADFYDIVNVKDGVTFANTHRGWSDLSSAHITFDGSGYQIVFPIVRVI